VQTADAPLTVLLIEDNAGDARLLMEYLSEAPGNPFALEHVDTLSDGLDRLKKGGVALVLLDLSLPTASASKRLHARTPPSPRCRLSS